MQLTPKERLFLYHQFEILRNQYEIMEAVGITGKEGSPTPSYSVNNCTEKMEMLGMGYEYFYPEMIGGFSETVSEEKSRLVMDILAIYRDIEAFKRQNTDDEIENHHLNFFRGFDGNNETEYMQFTRFIISTLGKFTEQEDYIKQNDNFNSHAPYVQTYQSMIFKWNDLGKDLSTRENILAILNARDS